MNINTDPSCDWTMDTDMVLGSSGDSDGTIVLVGSAGCLYQCGPNSSMVLELPLGLRFGPRSQVSALYDNRSFTHQFRFCLLQGHGPSHGPSHS